MEAVQKALDAGSPEWARASYRPDSPYHSPCGSGSSDTHELAVVNENTLVAREAWKRARKHRVESSDGMGVVREVRQISELLASQICT